MGRRWPCHCPGPATARRGLCQTAIVPTCLVYIPSKALQLAEAIKDPGEREKSIKLLASQVELAGLALLSLEQRSKLDQIRIRHAGMQVLYEPKMVELLKLSNDQRETIGKLLEERQQKLTAAEKDLHDEIRSAYDEKLRQVLNDMQQAMLASLSGAISIWRLVKK